MKRSGWEKSRMVVHRTKAEWLEIVEAFRRSGKTMTAFSKEQGISVKTLGNHVHREDAGIEEPVKKRSLKEWGALIEEQRSSGMKAAEWCKQQGIAPDTMRTAVRRLKESAGTMEGKRWVELGGKGRYSIPVVEKKDESRMPRRPDTHDKQTDGSGLEIWGFNGVRIRVGGVEIEADASYPAEKLSALIERLAR